MAKKQKKTRMRLSPQEVAYIQANCLKQTDEEIAKAIGRTIECVVRNRRKLGVLKGNRGKVLTMTPDAIKNTTGGNKAGFRLTEEERKNFFQTELRNAMYYEILQTQFSKEEMNYYLEEWGALCLQFEDILQSENRQIDELIKTRILMNRTLRDIKFGTDEIEKYVKEINKIKIDAPKKDDFSDNSEYLSALDDFNERLGMAQQTVSMMGSQVASMSRDYDKLVERQNSLLSSLNALRRDRVDSLKKKGVSLITLIEIFQDKKVREVQGRHQELLKLAKEKIQNEWRKDTVFPDGQKDGVLIDDKRAERIYKNKKKEEQEAKETIENENTTSLDTF